MNPFESFVTNEITLLSKSILNNDKPVIIFVDDEEILTYTMEKNLAPRLNNYNIIFLNDSFDLIGLTSLLKDKIILIITDISRPYMNGIETMVEIRKYYKDIKFLFQTAYGFESKGEEILSYTNTSFMDKPYTLDEIYEKVQSVLK